VVASTPFSVCLHEPAKECQSFKELKALWLSLPVYRGISDSGIVHQLPRIMKEIGPRTLIVDRDPKAVLTSFKKYWGKAFDEDRVQRLIAGAYVTLNAYHNHPLVKVVKFEALNDYDTAQECFRWLMPGNPHPMRRDLFDMRVNVDRNAANRDASRPHTFWHLEGSKHAVSH
jgi:hypothetical protein